MNKILFVFFVVVSGLAYSMPTPDIQEVGTVNVSVCSNGIVGTSVGVFNQNGICGEVGGSYGVNGGHNLSLDAKIGTKEGIGSSMSPSFAIGVFNYEIKQKNVERTSNNIFYVLTGKSYKDGRVHVGAFHGNRTMGLERKGFFFGYSHHLVYVTINEKKTPKVDCCCEYVTGNSYLKGAKAELKYYISERLSLRAGPQWDFNKVTKNTSKWSFEKATWIVTMSLDI